MRSYSTLVTALSTVLLALLVSCAGGGAAVDLGRPPALDVDRLDGVSTVLQRFVDEGRIAGAMGLVARADGVVWTGTAGWQDIDDEIEMEEDTIFRICSMTKPITSVGVLILVDEGKLSLDDPLSRYLPEFATLYIAEEVPAAKAAAAEDAAAGAAPATEGAPAGDVDWRLRPATRAITIRHLLTHTAGLSYAIMGHPYLAPLYLDAGISDGLVETDISTAENVRRLSQMPLLFEPGSQWHYSLAVDVLGRVIEVVSGQSLDAFLAERIFTPLEMEDTHFRLPDEKIERLATIYQPKEGGGIEEMPDGRVVNGTTIYSKSYSTSDAHVYRSGGAGLVSTAADYARFLRMLLNQGTLDGHRVLSEGMVEAMTTNQCANVTPLFTNHGDGFGLGVGVVTEAFADQGYGAPGSFSWGGFYDTYFWVDPRTDVLGVFLAQLQPWAADNQKIWDGFRAAVYAAIEMPVVEAAASAEAIEAAAEASSPAVPAAAGASD